MTGGQNKGRRFPPHTLTREDVEALLVACGNGWVGARNRALLVVYYRGGLRCREATAMQLGDVRHAKGGALVVRVEKPKGFARGAPPREVGLDPKAAKLLEVWLEQRGDAPGPLFCTRAGGPLHPSYVRTMFPRLGRRTGLGRRVHAHALRHTFARELYDEGVGIVEIMRALGHARLDTTQKYLNSIGANEVIAATTRRTW